MSSPLGENNPPGAPVPVVPEQPVPLPTASVCTTTATPHERTLQYIRDIVLGLVALGTLISGVMTSITHDKVVEVKQDVKEASTEVIDKQDKTLKKQDKAAATAVEVKKTLDETTGPQLYSAMTYLEDVASGPNATQADRDAATRARRAYEEHKKRLASVGMSP